MTLSELMKRPQQGVHNGSHLHWLSLLITGKSRLIKARCTQTMTPFTPCIKYILGDQITIRQCWTTWKYRCECTQNKPRTDYDPISRTNSGMHCDCLFSPHTTTTWVEIHNEAWIFQTSRVELALLHLTVKLQGAWLSLLSDTNTTGCLPHL